MMMMTTKMTNLIRYINNQLYTNFDQCERSNKNKHMTDVQREGWAEEEGGGGGGLERQREGRELP
jgi:hypothetical protein